MNKENGGLYLYWYCRYQTYAAESFYTKHKSMLQKEIYDYTYYQGQILVNPYMHAGPQQDGSFNEYYTANNIIL